MKNKEKIWLFILGFALLAGAVFTKHHLTYFFMDNRKAYGNYGFPLTGVIMTPEHVIEHIYIFQVIINILLILPMLYSSALCFKQQQYRKINCILITLFALSVLCSLFIPWKFSNYAFGAMVVWYTMGLLHLVLAGISYKNHP